MINDDILLKHDGRVPRYTSYPTAPQFSDAVDADTYAGWLAELPREQPLSLYFHVPFCDTMCWFCGCQTKVANHYGPVAAYLELLAREIDQVVKILGPGRPLAHVHWGGGSPTILTSADFTDVMAKLSQGFDYLPEAEVAVEIDPRGFGPDQIEALAASGVNRASIGIQDFDPTVQAAVNRVQPYDETKAVVDGLRRVGIGGLNFDLLYGLPHQTVDSVLATIDLAVGLSPDRISLFGYAHVPWMRPHQEMIDEDVLPDGRARLALYRAAAGRMAEHGFAAIGLDHFAAAGDDMAAAANEGRLHRNFQGYTTDEAEVLIGFGASAIGSLPQGYVQNLHVVPDYRAALEAGTLPVARGIAVDDDDRLRRTVIERLMCDLFVDLALEASKYGRSTDIFADSLVALEPLQADGIAIIEGDHVRVPEAARLGVRAVCAAFDAYMGQGPGRYSRAI